jgi:hypothetical protein
VNYKSRSPQAEAPPSGGVLSRPVGGVGKLAAGEHQVELLVLTKHGKKTTVTFATPGDHTHVEQVDFLPDWVRDKRRYTVRVGYTAGYMVVRSRGQVQVQDAQTRQPLSEWGEVTTVLDAIIREGKLHPCSTRLEAISDGRNSFEWHSHTAPAPETTPTKIPETESD